MKIVLWRFMTWVDLSKILRQMYLEGKTLRTVIFPVFLGQLKVFLKFAGLGWARA